MTKQIKYHNLVQARAGALLIYQREAALGISWSSAALGNAFGSQVTWCPSPEWWWFSGVSHLTKLQPWQRAARGRTLPKPAPKRRLISVCHPIPNPQWCSCNSLLPFQSLFDVFQGAHNAWILFGTARCLLYQPREYISLWISLSIYRKYGHCLFL